MRALITGCTGQDGHYLSALLNTLGYKVYGGYRRSSSGKLPDNVEPIQLELTEYESVNRAIKAVRPTEIYNLGAQTHVGESFGCPLYTADVNYQGVCRILECIREMDVALYQASTSEMFGGGVRLNEQSPFRPRSPYAVAKLAAHHACGIYRHAYGVRVSCGILFNHESPLRGIDFVTRKVCYHAARGIPIKLGNLTSKRDWGHAKDYVRAMQMMLQHEPNDFVIATGKSHSVSELVGMACDIAGTGSAPRTIIQDKREMRPWDVEELEGDPTKAKAHLKWEPEYDFRALLEEMIAAEKDALKLRPTA